MRRREFITLLGSGVAAAWPLTARTQQAAKPPIIGYLSPDLDSQSEWTAAFVRRLHELGWIEGRTLKIEYRWVEGNAERLNEFAAELVRLKVNIIVASATPPTLAAKRATSVIPIVFVGSGDPLGAGLVARSGAAGWQRDGSVEPEHRCRQ